MARTQATRPIPYYAKIDAILGQHRKRGQRINGGKLAIEMHPVRRCGADDSCGVGVRDIEKATGLTRAVILNAIASINGSTFIVDVGRGTRPTTYTFNRALCGSASNTAKAAVAFDDAEPLLAVDDDALAVDDDALAVDDDALAVHDAAPKVPESNSKTQEGDTASADADDSPPSVETDLIGIEELQRVK